MEQAESMDSLCAKFRSEVRFTDRNEPGLFSRICKEIQEFTEKYKDKLLLAWFAEYDFSPGKAVIVTQIGKDGLYRIWIENNDDFLSTHSLKNVLNDDALALAISRDCHDTAHDDRWCATCEARRDGIEAYREEIQRRIYGR